MVIKYEDYLKSIIEDLKKSAGRVSIFLEANPELLSTAKSTGADRIELYTEPYAIQYASDKTNAISPFKETAKLAGEIGLGVNAGHDLSLENLHFLTSQLPELQEVSIGHALVCDALYHGLQNTIQMYLSELDTMPR